MMPLPLAWTIVGLAAAFLLWGIAVVKELRIILCALGGIILFAWALVTVLTSVGVFPA